MLASQPTSRRGQEAVMNLRRTGIPLSVRGFLAGALIMGAISSRASAGDWDPPSRAARLSQTEGPVSFRAAGEADWDDALVNRPLTTGDQLSTDAGARAELRLDSATLRLDGGS